MKRLWPLLFTWGCNPADIQETVTAYYPELDPAAQGEQLQRLATVMPFYVTGPCLALVLMVLAVLNGLEHARALGRHETVRFGAYVLLLCFVSLFLAMELPRSVLPAGHPFKAFFATAAIAAVSTAIAARFRPDRAVLWVGYLSITLVLPLLAVLLGQEIYLMDTTAGVFIGFAAGLLSIIVLSSPVRGGLVDFLKRREEG